MKKTIKRYFAVNLLMIVGLALSYFILVNASSVVTAISNDEDNNIINQKIEFSLVYNGPAAQQVEGGILFDDKLYNINMADMINDMSVKKGILYTSFSTIINNSFTQKECNLILFQNEKKYLSYPYTNKGIVIGKDIINYCDNNTLKFIDNDYNVSYVLPSETINDYDERIFVDFNFLKEADKKTLINRFYEGFKVEPGLSFTYIGIDDNITDSFEQLCKRLKNKYDINIIIEEHEEYETIANEYNHISTYLLIIMLIFCIFNNLIIARLWINIRTKEMAIRKSYGYTIKNIGYLLFKDLSFLIIIAFILSVFAECIYCYLNKYHCISIKLFGQQLLIIIIGIFSITTLIILYALKKIYKMTITNIMTERNCL